jgi:hypothetical protein
MYSLVNQAATMPFFALSWALTLFSHDLYEVAVIARLFDFLLAHNPAMISYLVVAVRLAICHMRIRSALMFCKLE